MMNKSFITNEIRHARMTQVSCIGKYHNGDGLISNVSKDRYDSNTRFIMYNKNYEITVIGSMSNSPSCYISIISKSNDQSSTPIIPAAYEITSYIGIQT